MGHRPSHPDAGTGVVHGAQSPVSHAGTDQEKHEKPAHGHRLRDANALPVGCAMLAKSGVILDVNAAFLAMLETDWNAVAGSSFLLFLPPHQKNHFFTLLGQCEKHPFQAHKMFVLRTDQGREFHAELTVRREQANTPRESYSLAVTELIPPSDPLSGGWPACIAAASIVAWSWDLRTDAVEQSDNAAEILQMAPGHRVRNHVDMAASIAAADRDRYGAALDDAIRHRHPYAVHFRMAAGSEPSDRWLEERGNVVVDSQGTVTHLRGVIFEITALKRADDAMRANYQRMVCMIAESSDPIALIGDDGKVICVSAVGAALTGYSQEELQGMPVQQFVHPDDIRLALPRLRAAQGGHDIVETVLRLLTRTGEQRWLDVEVSFLLPNSSSRGYLARIRSLDLGEHHF